MRIRAIVDKEPDDNDQLCELAVAGERQWANASASLIGIPLLFGSLLKAAKAFLVPSLGATRRRGRVKWLRGRFP
jgi:hypothetical protein